MSLGWWWIKVCQESCFWAVLFKLVFSMWSQPHCTKTVSGSHCFCWIHLPGIPKQTIQNASRILLSCFWIFSITMVALYSGNNTALVTVHKQNLPIRNLEDLAAHPEYQAGVLQGSSLKSFFNVGMLFGNSGVDVVWKLWRCTTGVKHCAQQKYLLSLLSFDSVDKSINLSLQESTTETTQSFHHPNLTILGCVIPYVAMFVVLGSMLSIMNTFCFHVNKIDVFGFILQDARSTLLKTIWTKQINNNPSNLFRIEHLNEVLRRVCTEKFVLMGLKYLIPTLQDNVDTDGCNLLMAPDNFFVRTRTMAVRKDFPKIYKKMFNER